MNTIAKAGNVGTHFQGFHGQVSADTFGMNWIRRPISYDLTAGTDIGTPNDDAPTSRFGGTECAGWVRIFFGFDGNGPASGLFTTGTTMVVNRMIDLRRILQFWHGLGKKVLICLDGPVSALSDDMSLFADRLTIMLQRLAENNLDYIDAVEPTNEPEERLEAAFPGNNVAKYAKCAELMRATHTLFKVFSPRTIICTPCFQGGETEAIEAILASSALGVSVRGASGAGTRGEQYFDVVAYHPYAVDTTVELASASISSAALERRIRAFSTFIQTAVANRRVATDGGSEFWFGKPDPEYWATELNVYSNGDQITSNEEFRYQAFSPAQRARLIQSVVLGCLASGYSKVFPYAPDHVGDIGPWPVTAFATGANGDLRVTGGAAVPVFDGDLVFLQYGGVPLISGLAGMTGIAYNATSNGLAYDVAGVPAGTAPTQASVSRFLLGGWHQQWAAVQQSVTGYLEAGFYSTGIPNDPIVPEFRINRGYTQRLMSGTLTPVHIF